MAEDNTIEGLPADSAYHDGFEGDRFSGRPVTAPDLTPEQREMLERALCSGDPCWECKGTAEALAPVVARMLADADRQARAEGERVGAERVTKAVEAVLPDDCYITHFETTRCTDFVGGTFSNGTVWTSEMCCLPCQVRAALTEAAQQEPRS